MNNLCKFLRPYRIAQSLRNRYTFLHLQTTVFSNYSLGNYIACNIESIGYRNMSQKIITSFFKITPKKTRESKEDDQSSTPESINSPPKSQTKTSPFSNRGPKEKKTLKRQRIESSDEESQSPKPAKEVTSQSPVSSEKKKITKRQRIESSESEQGSPLKLIKSEPILEKYEEDEKMDTSKEAEIEIKVEKTPKTYSSPKTKKSKIKMAKNSPLVEKNVKTSPPIKEENQSPKKEHSPSKEKSEKSPVKKKIVNMSSFLKKENVVETGIKGSAVPEDDYNPNKTKYHPIEDACWSKGQEVPYLALAKTLEAIESTSARLKIVEILSNYYRSVIALTPEDLLPSVYMCLNQLAPAYHSLELGIAETYLMKAIGQCTGRTLAQVKAAAHKSGDLGQVAQSARATQRTMFTPAPLTCRKVFAGLKEIAHMTGQASVNKKIAKIQSLYIACRHSEAKYLIRSLEGKLRIGLAEQSVLQALAVATALTPPGPGGVATVDASRGLSQEQIKAMIDEQALLIKTTYCECPNYDLMIPALLQHGAASLPAHCRLTPGIPLKPMLAHPTKGLNEIFNRFENAQFTCEWKYDGERAQIHVPSTEDGSRADSARASIYSRNQENHTTKYPDILARLNSLLKDDVTSCVLDTEAVAYDVQNKQILPFQVLSTRKRKDAACGDIKVPVCVFVFDLLYLNGTPLVKEPLAKRRDLLRQHFNEVPGEWQFATSKDCTSMEEVQQFLDEAIAGSCEGLMVKMLVGENARYDIARRSHNWLKLKKDYLDGVGDTIDAVVIGAYQGKGKRAGRYGGFLLACVGEGGEEYQTLCKIGTGFSDEDLATLTEQLQEHVIDAPRSYYRYDASHTPDVWLSAGAVWEVRCADLSLSPAHRAAIGLVEADKGISLRFPRFVRARPDKTAEQATGARQLAEMYLAQDQVKNTASNKQANLDDFY